MMLQTMPKYLITILSLVVWCNNKNDEDIAITISAGAFFQNVPEAIMYDKSIPLVYTQEIDNNGLTKLKYSWGIQKYCRDKISTYCSIMNQTTSLLTIVNKNIIDNELDLSERSEENIIGKSRLKRGIQFIGGIYNFCCNVATKKQLKQFYTNEDKLNKQVNKFKNIFVSDHNDLINITTELNKYTRNTKNNIKMLKDTFAQFVLEEKINTIHEEINYENTIQGVQEVIYNLLTIMLKFTTYERDSSTHLHCKAHKIPPYTVHNFQ